MTFCFPQQKEGNVGNHTSEFKMFTQKGHTSLPVIDPSGSHSPEERGGKRSRIFQNSPKGNSNNGPSCPDVLYPSPLRWDFAALPSRPGVHFSLLASGLPDDALWQMECGRSDAVAFATGAQRPRPLPPVLSEPGPACCKKSCGPITPASQ